MVSESDLHIWVNHELNIAVHNDIGCMSNQIKFYTLCSQTQTHSIFYRGWLFFATSFFAHGDRFLHTCVTTKDTCLEVWGDGKRFNSNSTYWDDGNTYNGDGCSSTCKVESGYSCTGGSSSVKDIWSDIWCDGKRFNSIIYQN